MQSIHLRSWWSQANMLVGFVIFFFCIVAPAMYYTNIWNGEYLPLFSSGIFDNTGNSYNTTKVTNIVPGAPPTFLKDVYSNYSFPYLPTALSVSYFLSFASLTAVLVLTALFQCRSVWRQFRVRPEENADIHMRLMLKYKEAPFWWYGILFLVAFAMGIGGIEGVPTGLPWWAFIVGCVIGAVFMIPTGIATAFSGQEIGLYMISELIVGYMLPGRPIAMMIFKTLVCMVTYQAISFISDQNWATT